MEKNLEKILLSVQSPSRYIGGETNTPTIDENARVKFCVLVPELYEAGMLDMRAKTLYHKLNDRKGNSAERCFAPWLDIASMIKKAGIKLFSLESKKALVCFDALGISLKIPADFTTALFMLDLSGVTLHAGKRAESEPFVFGFGDACSNPEVVSAFLDFVIIGDADEVILQVNDTMRSAKTNKFSRRETLESLSKIRGVYVPQVVFPEYSGNGTIKKFSAPAVQKALSVDLDRAYFPTIIQVPNAKPVSGAVCFEPVRGCTRGCRFCMNGFISRPVRERRVSILSSEVMSMVTSTGTKEIEFSSRCFGDYSKLDALMNELGQIAKEKNARVLLPEIDGQFCFSDFVTLSSRDTITLSLEAGSDHMRRVINKNISSAEILGAVQKLARSGYTNFKINFMIGLPFETGADLMGIVETVKEIKQIARKNKTSKKPIYITANIACFVPKPFTPFAWCESISGQEAEKRFRFIKKGLKGLGVRVKLFSPEYSVIESVLSRGDRRVSEAIILAYKHGAVFDTNMKLFNFGAYKKAFEIMGVDIQTETKKRDVSAIQPWENVDMMVEKAYLLAEFEKAKAGIITPDCRGGCKACGLSQKGGCKHGNL